MVITATCMPAFGATRALLVGVSSYPDLPSVGRLLAPVNDVELMQNNLLQLGVSKPHIRILADGAQESIATPSRSNILREVDTLIASTHPEDWLILYFAGHGTQQPQLTIGKDGYIEPDGLNEVFLPYDAGNWDPIKRSLRNVILDKDIALILGRVQARGGRVWAIFDTCHSGDMGKGFSFESEKPLPRYVEPGNLGVPIELLRTAIKTPISRGKAAVQDNDKSAAIMFYATQSDQPTTEENIRDIAGKSSRRHGIFTWYLTQALDTHPVSFGVLAQRISQSYLRDKRPWPTPGFEGRLDQNLDFRGRAR